MNYRLLDASDEADAKRLHRKARRVNNPADPSIIIGIQMLKKIAHEWEAKNNQRCEGLEATQIGWNASVLIVRKNDHMIPPKYIDEIDLGDRVLHTDNPEFKKYLKVANIFNAWYTIINPSIKEQIGIVESVEGCLSVPGSSYVVTRPEELKFQFTLPTGQRSDLLSVKGFSAAALSHEIDHLLGKIISDNPLRVYVGETGALL